MVTLYNNKKINYFSSVHLLDILGKFPVKDHIYDP